MILECQMPLWKLLTQIFALLTDDVICLPADVVCITECYSGST